MPQKYYQEYGPIHRRRSNGELDPNEQPPEQPEQPPERRDLRRQHRKRTLWPWLALLVVIGGAAWGVPYALSRLDDGRVMTNVSLQGQSLSGLGRAELQQELQQRYGAFLQQPLTLSFEGRSWTPTLAQLGVTLDLDGTARSAMQIGRTGNPIQRGEQLWSLWQNGLDLAPQVTVNAAQLQSYLSSLATEIDQPPRDAGITLVQGKVLPRASETGRQVLVDATVIDVLQSIQTLTPGSVVIRSRALAPAISDQGIAAATDEAQRLLKGPLTLKRGEQQIVWDETKLTSLLTLQPQDGQLLLTINQESLEREVNRLAQVVDSPSAEPRLAFRNGQVTIVAPGQEGWKLKLPEAVTTISTTLLAAKHEVELPVETLQPQVTPESLPSLGIVELVGEGKSSFAGSAAYRTTNIKAGAARMDGVLLAPDQEFSFNTQLGAVDESNGFVEGYAVVGNRTQLEWGGGVCQDSTTMFRAAFWAGLPFTEWHPHPFYLSWYDDYAFPDASGPGMDATIYTGVKDLKFVNDTGHWLLIDAQVDDANQILTIRLYGTKPNRTVEISGPDIYNVIPAPTEPVYVNDSSLPSGTIKQSDTARKGMDIGVYRIITVDGVRQAPEPFMTSFSAWPNIFVRGTGN